MRPYFAKLQVNCISIFGYIMILNYDLNDILRIIKNIISLSHIELNEFGEMIISLDKVKYNR